MLLYDCVCVCNSDMCVHVMNSYIIIVAVNINTPGCFNLEDLEIAPHNLDQQIPLKDVHGQN